MARTPFSERRLGGHHVDEQARLALLARLNETLGREHASTLMASLPIHDWSDLVTKDDLRRGLEGTENRLEAAFHREFTRQTRIYVLAIVSTVIALSGVAILTS